MATPPNVTPRLAWDIYEVPKLGGPSRATIYRLEKAGKLRLIRGAGRVKIADSELRRLLQLEAQP